MADEEKEGEAENAGSGKKKLILIIVGALLLVGIGVGATLLLLGGDSSEEASSTEPQEEVRGDPVYVDLDPPFTVNLDPEDSVGFLQISMQILTYDEKVAEDLGKHKPLIRNNLVTLFSQQKSIGLRTSAGKQDLQQSALDLIQTIISNHGSGGDVDDVFFTTFVMQ